MTRPEKGIVHPLMSDKMPKNVANRDADIVSMLAGVFQHYGNSAIRFVQRKHHSIFCCLRPLQSSPNPK